MALAQRAFATTARPQARPAVALARPARTQTVKVQALFGFGGGSKAASGATPASYICIDCGYIYDGGDFKGAPSSYKCPACGSPKSRFKVYKGDVKGRPNNTGAAMKKRMAEKAW